MLLDLPTAIYLPDAFRGVAITTGTTAMALFPGALTHRIPGWRAALVSVTIVLLFFGYLVAVVYAFGDPLLWYSSPLLFVASILALIYIISIRGKQFWRDS